MRTRIWLLVPLVFSLLTSCQQKQRLVTVELEQADEIKMGAALMYRGVQIGRVESIALDAGRKLPAARVVLTPDSPQLTSRDEFRITASGLLGDYFIEVVPGKNPGTPLPNTAIVHAQPPHGLHFKQVDQISKALDSFNLLTELQALPEPKRAEVLKQIRKLLDDAKKESGRK